VDDVLPAVARGVLAVSRHHGAEQVLGADEQPELLKEELFGAVMSINPTALSRIAQSFSGPADGLGERVTRTFLEVWEGAPTDSEPLLAMLRGAINNEQATTQLREFIEARLYAEVPPDLRDDPTGRTRVGLASSMLVGVIVGRRLVQVPTLVKANTEALVELIAPAVQSILTGDRKSTSV
jgi:hypothetical protein